MDLERSLQCCQRALAISTASLPSSSSSSNGINNSSNGTCHSDSPTHGMALMEILSRLAITRTLARVIDTTDASAHLIRAAELALALGETAALGWIALQLGITLELSGLFPESLEWYAAAGRLARESLSSSSSNHNGNHGSDNNSITIGNIRRRLCNVLCCQAIACYAIEEVALADMVHAESRRLFTGTSSSTSSSSTGSSSSLMPRAWHQRPLQNFVQLKLQAGDMAGALRLHEQELALARELGDAATAARCLGSIALARRHLGAFTEAAAAYLAEMAAQPPAMRGSRWSLSPVPPRAFSRRSRGERCATTPCGRCGWRRRAASTAPLQRRCWSWQSSRCTLVAVGGVSVVATKRRNHDNSNITTRMKRTTGSVRGFSTPCGATLLQRWRPWPAPTRESGGSTLSRRLCASSSGAPAVFCSASRTARLPSPMAVDVSMVLVCHLPPHPHHPLHRSSPPPLPLLLYVCSRHSCTVTCATCPNTARVHSLLQRRVRAYTANAEEEED